MKKIAISLGIIGVVAAIVIGATTAYFSDTETSGRNTFTAGTIDITIEDGQTWTGGFEMKDMKPSYTDYINFVIHNDGSNANPVNVWKKLYNFEQTTGTESEPECTDQGGCWDASAKACDWGCGSGTEKTDKNNIASIIDYDLSVEVYNGQGKIWWQTIYDKDVTVGKIAGQEIYLGMIPAGGRMEVTQSYHMQDPDSSTNWAQGDKMAFDIEIKAVQLRGTAWLENKTGAEPWKIIHNDGIEGTLTYEVKHPTFDFTFTGKAPLVSHDYVLAAGMKSVGGNNYDVDTKLGEGSTDASRNITITGDVDTGDMKDVKVWLVPKENWTDGTGMDWGGGSGWPGMASETLWETGLIWYEDTD